MVSLETFSPQATRIPLKTRSYLGARTTPMECAQNKPRRDHALLQRSDNSMQCPQISHTVCIFLVLFSSRFRFHLYIIVIVVRNLIFTPSIIFMVKAFTVLYGFSAATSFSYSLVFYTPGSAPASPVGGVLCSSVLPCLFSFLFYKSLSKANIHCKVLLPFFYH